MTKYILHGGNTREVNPDNDSFFQEMTLGGKGKTLVLLNYFSREDNEIEELAKQDKQRFLLNSKNKELEFEIAQPEIFAEQLKKAYVMYMRGGETDKFKEKLSRTSNIEKLFKNKVIAGSSAGVYVLSKYYWGNDNAKIGEGLGILNFKAFCHYQPKDIDIIEKLLQHKEDLPLLVLPNYKWVVLYR